MADLPNGTVIFLFTDVEGSTRLWEQYPRTMSTALCAIEHGGHVPSSDPQDLLRLTPALYVTLVT